MEDYNNYYNRFCREEKDFLKKVYPTLTDDTKQRLWKGMFISEVMHASRSGEDGLEIFTATNLKKWRKLEPTIDHILDEVIVDIDLLFNPWHEDCDWEDCGLEIERRLGRA